MHMIYGATWRSWKRAGLITLRSLDRNELLLYDSKHLFVHLIATPKGLPDLNHLKDSTMPSDHCFDYLPRF
ncbi:hypothetical protein A0H81_04774 [Grifola frondosa]|uniref:Uncharacterized protein n=1 Tax=Grifola frondosa TaxID=5627 RepID=A0A1C7MHD8_GRIFR|nr:hypothetical protein A0H81_04774 [Grifola frondosa]